MTSRPGSQAVYFSQVTCGQGRVLDLINSLVFFCSDYTTSSKLLSSSHLSHMLRFFQPQLGVSLLSPRASSQPGRPVLSSSLLSPPPAAASASGASPALLSSPPRHKPCKWAAAPLGREWRVWSSPELGPFPTKEKRGERCRSPASKTRSHSCPFPEAPRPRPKL